MADAKKQSLFKELKDELFQEAAELVSEDPSASITIVITPPPGYEGKTACAFGHRSPDVVIKDFLDGNDKGKAIVEDEEEEEEKEWNDYSMPLETMNLEQLNAAFDQFIKLRDQLFLPNEARSRGEGSSQNPDDQPNL